MTKMLRKAKAKAKAKTKSKQKRKRSKKKKASLKFALGALLLAACALAVACSASELASRLSSSPKLGDRPKSSKTQAPIQNSTSRELVFARLERATSGFPPSTRAPPSHADKTSLAAQARVARRLARSPSHAHLDADLTAQSADERPLERRAWLRRAFLHGPGVDLLNVWLALVYCSIIFATAVGNLFVIVAILFEKTLRTVGNYLVLSLALADLLVALIVMPFASIYQLVDEWTLGIFLCDVWTSADVFCCTGKWRAVCRIANQSTSGH